MRIGFFHFSFHFVFLHMWRSQKRKVQRRKREKWLYFLGKSVSMEKSGCMHAGDNGVSTWPWATLSSKNKKKEKAERWFVDFKDYFFPKFSKVSNCLWNFFLQFLLDIMLTDSGLGKKKKKKEEKRRMKIVATTSLPAVDRPNADRWNAARSRQ